MTVDEYLVNFPAEQVAELQYLRHFIKNQVPEAEEVITYGMPGYKYNGKYLIAYAAFKDHLSIFPGGVISVFADDLKDFNTSKGTIQFTADKRVPDDLIAKLLTFRTRQIDA